MTSLRLEVLDAAPSMNRLMRMHWSSRNRLVEKWRWLIFAEVYRLGGPIAARPTGKFSVTITRCYRRVPLDPDNLHGAAKVVLDALRHCNLIWDDSPAHLELRCEQIQGAPRTVIEVTLINAQTKTSGSPPEPAVSPC